MKKLSIDKLTPGMILGRTIINDKMVVILSSGTMLTQAHITRLKFLNTPFAYIKDDFELSSNYQIVEIMFNKENAFVKKYNDVVLEANELFTSLGKKKDISIEETGEKVKNSLLPTVKESGVIDFLYTLSNISDNVCHHSVRVSILSGVIGKWLRFSENKINDLILAGFLHDIGKTMLPEKIVNRNPETLKPDDYELYIQHTINGQKILSDRPGISEGVRASALQHHEAMDGTGEPFGVSGKDIDEYARIVAVADRYDNITTEREGEIKHTPFDAVELIAKSMFSSLDAQICVPFIANIQNSFLGSIVGLNDGRRGRIVYYPADYLSLPIIRIDDNTVLDLNEERRKNNTTIIEYNPK
ncbi:HD-GYP domain-containing protein [Pectinatus cerevisiiphilus]|uniref:HD-GYP domain-containing protein (C-di-GMP phosphodiesterase class II) n=1 Tax=Pectinatus cerevisiiphilus TaxID=86956 RepID=A0A4R3KFC0_9FIRM|nr:HD domain-containing phosphohydrolase [Pectinatus cerevisiiphilus]TCS81341.1 HD-GYP domain-containing protein (c-di-GMP phosphodiesterase class II) [Pectinatus cerevisiiphilus]